MQEAWWLDQGLAQISEVEENPFMSSLINYLSRNQKPAVEKEGGGGRSYASHPHHHPFLQLIRGYFISRRRNCYSPPRCFIHDQWPRHRWWQHQREFTPKQKDEMRPRMTLFATERTQIHPFMALGGGLSWKSCYVWQWSLFPLCTLHSIFFFWTVLLWCITIYVHNNQADQTLCNIFQTIRVRRHFHLENTW